MISGSMRLNVTRMDSKGRISIPIGLRHYMRLREGDKLVLRAQSSELQLLSEDAGNAELFIRFNKSVAISEALADVMHIISKHKINIASSEAQMLDEGACWQASIDAADCKKLKNELAQLKNVKEVSMKKGLAIF